jgi:hypothetical protein
MGSFCIRRSGSSLQGDGSCSERCASRIFLGETGFSHFRRISQLTALEQLLQSKKMPSKRGQASRALSAGAAVRAGFWFCGPFACTATRTAIKAVLLAQAARTSSCRPSHVLSTPPRREKCRPGFQPRCHHARSAGAVKPRLKGFSTSSRRGTTCFAHPGYFSHRSDRQRCRRQTCLSPPSLSV